MTESSSTQQADECRLTQLMIAYQAGDLGAFEQLYAMLADEARRYFARTHRDRNVARDLVQDLFLEIHRSRRSYTPPLPVRPWIFGIARNVSARNRRATRFQASESVEQNADIELAASAVASTEALDVESALTALPASTREPWLLHHVFGINFETIAARLGITVVAAKLRSSRATRALRLALNASGGRADE